MLPDPPSDLYFQIPGDEESADKQQPVCQWYVNLAYLGHFFNLLPLIVEAINQLHTKIFMFLS